MKTINLLESKPFQLTYRRMIGVAGIAVVAIVLLFGLLSLRTVYTENRIAQLSQEVEVLKGQKKELEKKLGAHQPAQATSGLQTLKAQFQTRHLWTPFLRDLVSRVPPELALNSLEGTRAAGASRAALQVSGSSPDMIELTSFIHRMSRGFYVRQPSKSETEVKFIDGKPAYLFTIDYQDVQL